MGLILLSVQLGIPANLHIVTKFFALMWTLFLHWEAHSSDMPMIAGGKLPGKYDIIFLNSSLSRANSTPDSSNISRMAQILKATSPGNAAEKSTGQALGDSLIPSLTLHHAPKKKSHHTAVIQ